jgi:hypothetical protein
MPTYLIVFTHKVMTIPVFFPQFFCDVAQVVIIHEDM